MELKEKDMLEQQIKNKIKLELEYLGYRLNYLGTHYLIETIYDIYCLEDYYDYNLERDIYPIVAKKFHTSVQSVKCNIRNATEKMFLECNQERLMNYLKFYVFSKPGPKTIIFAVLNRL